MSISPALSTIFARTCAPRMCSRFPCAWVVERIKAFEAMAMDWAVVSTAIGIEGLDVRDGVQYLGRDSASDQAAAIVELLGNPELLRGLAHRARHCVESRFGHVEVARVFERACVQAMEAAGSTKRSIAAAFGARTPAKPQR